MPVVHGHPADLTLTMTRELPAGRAAVSWAFSPRVGQRYRFEVQPPQGEHFHVTGRVREADPPSRLALTFAYEQPNPDDVENLVGLSFRDLGESTRVDLTQGPFRTEERRALHHDGWSDSFDKLERFIAARG